MARPGAGRLEKKLLTLVAASPEVARDIPDELIEEDGQEWQALRELVAFFREHPDRTWAQASAYFEGSGHSVVVDAAIEDPLFKEAESPDFNVKGEVADLLDRLREDRRSRRGDELARLMGDGTATPQDIAEYRDLQSAKSGTPSPE